MAKKDDTTKQTTQQRLRLFHPYLSQLPLPLRFVLSGVIGNVFFMTVYNAVYSALVTGRGVSATWVFSMVQFVCIVVNHALNMGIVFGWPKPKNYISSLMSNMPVGLSSLALGAILAGYLERIDFDGRVVAWSWWINKETLDENDSSTGFYSSIVVMLTTGVYNYVALNLVNRADSKNKDETKQD